MDEDKITISYDIYKKILPCPSNLLEVFNNFHFKQMGMQTTYETKNNHDLFKEFLQNYLNKEFNNKYIITNIWAQKYEAGNHSLHIHSRSFYSLSWYIHTEENCSNLNIYNLGHPYVETHKVVIKPKTGLLLLFPSFLPHEVEFNLNKKRYIISANLDLKTNG